MKCPICGERAAAKETREAGATIQRRRYCVNGHRIFTEEVIVRGIGGTVLPELAPKPLPLPESKPAVTKPPVAARTAKAPAKQKQKQKPEPVAPPPKITYGPSSVINARHQVDPSSRPFGAGFAAAGIGRDVETGRGWN